MSRYIGVSLERPMILTDSARNGADCLFKDMAEDEISQEKAEGKEDGHEGLGVVEEPFHDRSGAAMRGI